MSINKPEHEHLWDLIQDRLSDRLGGSTMGSWIRPIRSVGIQADVLHLSAAPQIRDWVSRRYRAELELALQSEAPQLNRIEFVEASPAQPVLHQVPSTPGSELPVLAQQLNPDYTFDRFVIGNQNRLAHSAALAAAEMPGEGYNPLYLYGPPGLGKTHLLVAIAHYLDRNRPDLHVRYTTAEQFTAEFVSSLRQDGTAAFKRRYRDLGALLIDDVQFFEAKLKTEEEFFHTFNALYESGSQIVLSSDRPASSLSNLAERLRDRFDWGLAAQLGRPDVATRLTLLRKLADESPNPEPDIAVLNEIAKRTPTNLRRLQGALTKVTAYSSLIGEPPTVAIVRELLPSELDSGQEPADGAQSRPPEAPPVAIIQDAVCEVTRVSRADLISTKRTPDVVRARQLAMYLTRDLTNLSLKQIALEFERDHSTIAHGIQTTHSRLEPGNDMHRALERCREVIGRSLD